MKCDYCENPAIGYTKFCGPIYCVEHEALALEAEAVLIEIINETNATYTSEPED